MNTDDFQDKTFEFAERDIYDEINYTKTTFKAKFKDKSGKVESYYVLIGNTTYLLHYYEDQSYAIVDINLNMNYKEQLSKKLNSISFQQKNRALLIESFGEENIKTLNDMGIDKLIINTGGNSWDGNTWFEVTLSSGICQDKCSVAELTAITLIEQFHIEKINDKINELIDAKLKAKD